ncbi:type II toxin-antitoxin system death-on-curing family toxin [Amycolatopsis sp. WGS_07]|uniref:type II toxin-antitoxin system death-on-curing family toxin n=1 Tax=Amycolatopsis sp. WGS_07 TaxID=3076764 RepID=UPI003872F5CA
MKIEYLTLDDLLALSADLRVPGVRDLGLLDAAAHRPQSSLMGQDAYPSPHEKAAVLLESIVRNHPLIDGNKRLGWMAVFVFYGLNGFDLDAPEDEAYDLVIATSTGTVPYQSVAERLAKWSHVVIAPPNPQVLSDAEHRKR